MELQLGGCVDGEKMKPKKPKLNCHKCQDCQVRKGGICKMVKEEK